MLPCGDVSQSLEDCQWPSEGLPASRWETVTCPRGIGSNRCSTVSGSLGAVSVAPWGDCQPSAGGVSAPLGDCQPLAGGLSVPPCGHDGQSLEDCQWPVAGLSATCWGTVSGCLGDCQQLAGGLSVAPWGTVSHLLGDCQ